MKSFKNYITLLVGVIALLVAIIMVFKGKTLDAVLYTQFATLMYLLHKDER